MLARIILPALLLFPASFGALGAGDGPSGRHVFIDVGLTQADLLGVEAPDAKRIRPVAIDTAALFGEGVNAGVPDERITLNLFDGVQVEAVRKQADLGIGGTPMWFGELPEAAGGGHVIFVMRGEAVSGRVWSPRLGRFVIEPVRPGVVAVMETGELDVPRCGAGDLQQDFRAPENLAGRRGVVNMPLADPVAEGTFIFADVLVAYTDIARANIGGTPNMLAWIDAEVAESNLIYQNSQINLRIRLAGATEVSYVQDVNAMGTDLNRLTNTSDGILDSVHPLRNALGADIVTLLVPGQSTDACGIAWIMINVGNSFQTLAFNVVGRTCGGFVFAHELGHNMGCAHDRDNAGSASHAYAYGFRGGGNRTVMAYSPGNWIPYFSNPDVLVGGLPIGVPINQSLPCHNALAINNNSNAIAGWRVLYTSPPGGVNLLTPTNTVTTSSRTPTFSWDASTQTDYYELLVDNNADFSSPEIAEAPLTATSFTEPNSPPISLASGQTYFWKVIATNPLGSTTSSTRSFATPPNAPGAFALTSPGAGASNITRNPTFSWSASLDSNGYTLTADDNSDFGSPEISIGGLTGTSFSYLGVPLTPLTVFYWKVTSTNAISTTASTPVSQSFMTTGGAPGAFSLLSPVDGSNIATLTPTLSWSASQFADTYRLIVDDDLGLTSPVFNQAGLVVTSLQLPPATLFGNVRYYWQVQATNATTMTNSSPAVATFGVLVPVCQGDANGDRLINFTDISTILGNWATAGPMGDSDHNGAVNFGDVSTTLGQWSVPCP